MKGVVHKLRYIRQPGINDGRRKAVQPPKVVRGSHCGNRQVGEGLLGMQIRWVVIDSLCFRSQNSDVSPPHKQSLIRTCGNVSWKCVSIN